MVSLLLDLLAGLAGFVMLLFRGVFLLVGLFLIHRWWAAREVERRCGGWMRTVGTIRRSRMDERTFVGMRRHRYQGYRADIEYEYSIAGQAFRSTRVTTYDLLVGRSSSYARHRPETEALLREYPAGADVPVYYDPANPQDAILRQGASREAETLLFIGLAFAGAGVLFLT